jgi:hypothetical protein
VHRRGPSRYAGGVFSFAIFPGDSALLLLVVVMGFFVVLGIISDGLRMAMLGVATGIAYFAAPLLGQFVPRSFLPDNPLWRDLGVGAIHAFVVIMVLLFIGAHFLHRWVEIELKYKWSARKLKEWDRVNSMIGLCLGGVLGVFYFLGMAGLITPVGYATAQMQPADPSADPAGYRLSARLYRDFHTLGVDKAARMFDPAPSEYYAAIDVAGLVYNNFGTNNLQHIYQFRARLLGYPGLVDAAYHPDVTQLTYVHAQNPFFVGLYSRTNLTHLLANQTFQSAFGDPGLRMQLTQVDMDDLRKYLRHLFDPIEGSTHYNSASLTQQGRPKILGRWILDVDNTLEQFDRQFPNMDDRAKRNLATYIKAIGDQLSLSFSDGKFYLEARYFHNRQLAREANDFIPRAPTPISAIQNSPPKLQLLGPWEKVDNSRFKVVFQWKAQDGRVTSECPVLIESFSSQIILTLEGFRNEKYVFRRQKF